MQADANPLVERIRRGERAAAAELCEQFYARIYAFLRRLTANEVDAADLTQRTFSRIWQALASFEGRASLGSWIHSIAYHIYVDWRRTNHRTEPRSQAWWTERASPEPAPDEVVAREDLRARVYSAVDRLPPDLRETVHLHYYQELSLAETAAAMGVAPSTVKYRLRQALGTLETELASQPTPTLPLTPSRIV